MHLKLSKLFAISCILVSSSFANNIEYNYHDIHTKIPTKGTLGIGVGYKTLNDTVDVLNIKETEFGSTQQFDSIGDLNGFEFWTHYSVTNNFMLFYKNSMLEIEYGSNTIENLSNEIYSRFNLKNSFSFDIGFIHNQLNNFYITDLNNINQLGKRYFGSDNFNLKQEDKKITLFQKNDYTVLEYNPWLGLEDTSDSSIYFRLLNDIELKNAIFDYYGGLKYTQIKNKIVANKELVSIDPSIEKDLNRDEMMLFFGINLTYIYQKAFFEFGYEYNRFKRDSGLDYINQNHIIDLTLGYNISDALKFYFNGKVMSNQLNGEVPYLYNQYTQTTYDHKYGYITTGLKYSF